MTDSTSKSLERYEYDVTYIDMKYKPESHASPNRVFIPIPKSIWNDDDFHKELSEMGNEGWELVSVQPLLKGEAYSEPMNLNLIGGSGSGKGGIAYAVPLTAGYYLFWKRVIQE